jgi:hypothetical protein
LQYIAQLYKLDDSIKLLGSQAFDGWIHNKLDISGAAAGDFRGAECKCGMEIGSCFFQGRGGVCGGGICASCGFGGVHHDNRAIEMGEECIGACCSTSGGDIVIVFLESM